jgi:hypothetical protein
LRFQLFLLYLHCNVCSSSFNGCDGGAPYILNLKDYEDLVKNYKDDICQFIKKIKLRERRIEGLVRVSMDKYKEIKKHQIRKEYSALSQQITKLNEKKLTNCFGCVYINVLNWSIRQANAHTNFKSNQ